MERTTQKDECGYYLVGDGIYSDWGAPEKFRGDDVDRLAAIEDILGDEYDLDLVQKLIQAYREGRYIILKEPEQAGVSRLRELAQADREGRCVVLPKDGMVYYIEEAGGEKWIGNKPIQQVILRCGFGMALLEFSLFDKGKYFSRAEAEEALRREQE